MNESLVQLRFFIEQIELRDIIDLVLVWIVVYHALQLTKKSGAVQILSGMGVLALAYFASSYFNLVTFNWILELIFSNLFLIVVILFQGEIRRALAQIGSNPLLFGTSSIEARHNIEEVAQGVIQLAQNGIGALIVIEREIVLDYFVESGTEIDSTISAELLHALFANQSPIHDGAVIIRGGRIFSGGNFLPLSVNPALDKNLGTRHRAAIGLAEQTDAIVIVVSEETRGVNLIHGGHFVKNVAHGDLRKQLYDLLGIKHKPEWSAST